MAKRKVSRTPLKKQMEEQRNDIFSALSTDGAAHMNGPDYQEPAPDAGKEGTKDPTAELYTKIGALEARLEQMTMMQMVQPEPVKINTQITPPQKKELPDPTLYPEEYARAVHENIMSELNAKQQAEREQAQTKQQESSKYDALYEDFAIAYPEIAEHEDRLEFVAAQVVRDAQKRGIDPNRYMFQHQQKFMADIAARYEQVFGSKTDEGKGEEDQDDGRSTSIFGGLEAGPQGGRRQTPPQGDMIKEIHAEQRKMGLF